MPDADIDIVAVHGLQGHFEGTWTDQDSKQLWLRDSLPSQLRDAGRFLQDTLNLFEGVLICVGIVGRLMSYGYDFMTAFSKSVTDIEDQATMLLNALASARVIPSEKARPLVFIGHGLGGIIIEKV